MVQLYSNISTIEAKSIFVMIFESFDVPLLSLVSPGFSEFGKLTDVYGW